MLNSIEMPQRRIILEGCYNLRDTGGYATADGRTTRWGVLLRADGLHRLPKTSQERLLAHPIRTIIDLRRPHELEESPNVFASSGEVDYLNISLVEDPSEARTLPSLEELYKRMLDNSQPQIKQLFETLSTPGRFPVLIHCTAGKDRTGLVVALLLALANVPDETIAADYALSAEYLSPLFVELRHKIKQTGQDLAQFEKLLASRPEMMLETLDYLNHRYGGARQYLSELGLNENLLAFLQNSLVE
jgi:protein-tyrosine phosphatase